MVAMLKEKINTLFSFPQQLNMADYMESNLLMVSDPYLRFYLMTWLKIVIFTDLNFGEV